MPAYSSYRLGRGCHHILPESWCPHMYRGCLPYLAPRQMRVTISKRTDCFARRWGLWTWETAAGMYTLQVGQCLWVVYRVFQWEPPQHSALSSHCLRARKSNTCDFDDAQGHASFKCHGGVPSGQWWTVCVPVCIEGPSAVTVFILCLSCSFHLFFFNRAVVSSYCQLL